MKKSTHVKRGFCPSCGSYNMTYKGSWFDEDDTLIDPYTCRDCLFEGAQVFTVQFNAHQFYISEEEGYDIMYEGQTLLQDALSFAEYQAKHVKKKGKKK